jgi:hypothetical protein
MRDRSAGPMLAADGGTYRKERLMATHGEGPAEPAAVGGDDVSGWAVGGIVFAATMMVIIGFFQSIAGLVAIIDDEFYVVTRNYTFPGAGSTCWWGSDSCLRAGVSSAAPRGRA